MDDRLVKALVIAAAVIAGIGAGARYSDLSRMAPAAMSAARGLLGASGSSGRPEDKRAAPFERRAAQTAEPAGAAREEGLISAPPDRLLLASEPDYYQEAETRSAAFAPAHGARSSSAASARELKARLYTPSSRSGAASAAAAPARPVRYGARDRRQLMFRAAGPVYNFASALSQR